MNIYCCYYGPWTLLSGLYTVLFHICRDPEQSIGECAHDTDEETKACAEVHRPFLDWDTSS